MEIRQVAWRNKRILSVHVLICWLLLQSDILFTVNGQVVKPIEADSSPSNITAIKGSSVWLHWNYTYLGDGAHFGGYLKTNYIEQIIGFSSTSQPTIQALAKRTGQNGVLTLESPMPAPFNGRVEVISSNSTLVIHDLQYNDSSHQFSSNVEVAQDTGGGPEPNLYKLKPIVAITINGIPAFIRQPPSLLDVNEQSTLQFRIEMDGNPKPSADFKWIHLPSSSSTTVPSVQMYPFVHSAKYLLNHIDGSYCGRILQTTIKNSIGSSSVRETNVTVLLNLDKPLDLKVVRLVESNCIDIKWNKVESGVCIVKYDVKLKDASEKYYYNKTGYNIREMKICNVRDSANITHVEMMASFKNVTSNAFEANITTQAPTSAGNKIDSGSSIGVIVGAIVGGLIFVIAGVVIVAYYFKKYKRGDGRNHESGQDYPLQQDNKSIKPDEVV